MLIDEILPKYDKREYHEIEIKGNLNEVYQAVRFLDFSDSLIIRRLFRLRGLPATMKGLGDLLRVGFVLVDELPGEELVLGFVGKFWTPTAEILRLSPSQYLDFNLTGYAKGAWNFAVSETSRGLLRLSTETRIMCTDDRSRKRFLLYWRIIGRLSALTRTEMLRGVKRKIELA